MSAATEQIIEHVPGLRVNSLAGPANYSRSHRSRSMSTGGPTRFSHAHRFPSGRAMLSSTSVDHLCVQAAA
jgi:hypothetical protein